VFSGARCPIAELWSSCSKVQIGSSAVCEASPACDTHLCVCLCRSMHADGCVWMSEWLELVQCTYLRIYIWPLVCQYDLLLHHHHCMYIRMYNPACIGWGRDAQEDRADSADQSNGERTGHSAQVCGHHRVLRPRTAPGDVHCRGEWVTLALDPHSNTQTPTSTES